MLRPQTGPASMGTLPPEERHRVLTETRPELLSRIPQYQLASYLGLAPESLSRIKSRLRAKKRKT